MQGIYKFYFVDDNLHCLVKDINGSKVYTDKRAISLLKKVNREPITSVRVQNKNKDYSLRLRGIVSTISLSDLDKFYKHNLFDYMPNHVDKMEKSINRYIQNKNRDKKVVKKRTMNKMMIKNLVIGTTIMSLISSGIFDFTLNKNYKKDEKNSKEVEERKEEKKENKKIKKEKVKEERRVAFFNTGLTSFEDNTDSSDFKYVKKHYGELIEETACERGISPNLLMAMVTQESAGRDDNLLQVQYDSWEGMEIPSYNFYKDKWEKWCLTENPTNHKDCITIGRDTFYNRDDASLKVGAVILSYLAKEYNYNIPLTIQAYNYGTGNINKVLKAMEKDLGIDKDTIIKCKNTNFTDYTDVVNVGDSDYLDHVMRYVDERSDGIHMDEETKSGIEQHDFYFDTVKKKSNAKV